MSVLTSIQIAPEITTLSKSHFSKTRYHSLYFTTSLTTLLLLQACGKSSSVTLDDAPRDVVDNGNDDDGGNDDGPQDVVDEPQSQPPRPAEIIRVLQGIAGEVNNGDNSSEVIYQAREEGDFTANAGDDVLVSWQAGEASEIVLGGRGNDYIRTVIGTQTLRGNNGDDVIFSEFASSRIYVEGGNDVLFIEGSEGDADNGVERSENEAYGGADNDVLFAGLGLSRLYGGAGHDVLHYDFTIADLALTSEAHLWGGAGDDLFIIQVPESHDSLIYIHDYGHGNDVIYISDNLEVVDRREIARDEDAGTRTVHLVYGFMVHDEVIERLIFVHELPLPASQDDLPTITFYDPFNHLVDGKFRSPDDAPYSFVIGSEFKDVLNFGQGNDYALAGEGDDTITSGGGNDYIYAGPGHDVVQAGPGNDFIFGEDDNDGLYGDDGNDTLYGDGGNDILYGGAGNDHLYGGIGRDELYGGTGNDYLEGGAMQDRLIGGAGGDIFAFYIADIDQSDLRNADIIEDFELGVDRILLGQGYGSVRDDLHRVVTSTPDSDVVLYYADPETNVRVNIALLRGITLRVIDEWEGETGLNFFDEIILTAELV